MKKIIIGTKNQAKVKQIRGALAPLEMKVSGLPEDRELPEVEENGKTAQENARKKALHYAGLLNAIVLSMDNALYFEGLSDEDQPGIHVRRIKGASDRPTDDEMREYYSKLIESLGGEINGRFEFAICIADPSGEIQETTIVTPRVFISKMSLQIIAGYPLESLQIDPKTKKYISEMTQSEQDIVRFHSVVYTSLG